MKARQNLRKRVAGLESAVRASSDSAEQDRLLDKRERLQERRGIVAPPFPETHLASPSGGDHG